jgi:hypothetical protein
MEHRWGERVGVRIAVRVFSHAYVVRQGCLTNLSVSGAFLAADAEFRLLSQVRVRIEVPNHPKREAPTVDAYVTRRFKSGVGLEWCEFSPAVVARLLRTAAAHRYGHLRRPEPPAALVVARLSAPLLKHGT